MWEAFPAVFADAKFAIVTLTPSGQIIRLLTVFSKSGQPENLP